MGLKQKQLIKLDEHYRALHRSEHHVTQEPAPEQRAYEEIKVDHNGLQLLIQQLGGKLWRKGC